MTSALRTLSPTAAVFRFFGFFFKQKTAYEMRISDWSSDVCSSDLTRHLTRRGIELFNLSYCGEKVFDLLNRPHRPDMVEVRYDHGDLSYILVLDPLTRTYVKLPSTEPEYTAGLTLAQHKFILDQTRKRKQGQKTVGGLAATCLHLETAINDMVTRNLSMRPPEIGRAPRRESMCKSVKITVVAGSK